MKNYKPFGGVPAYAEARDLGGDGSCEQHVSRLFPVAPRQTTGIVDRPLRLIGMDRAGA